jgi:hypothetical protein
MDKIQEENLPGLYLHANISSQTNQKYYFGGLAIYLILLFIGSLFSFLATDPDPIFKFISALLFLVSLALLIWQKVSKPEDIWYNGRAVAESVKTRAWRYMMKAMPYEATEEASIKIFISDLKNILNQNKSLVSKLNSIEAIKEPISKQMKDIRRLSLQDRLDFYKRARIEDQKNWYIKKAAYNKRMGIILFWVTVLLHSLAITFLLYNINEPTAKFPISIIGVACSCVLSWLQAKKHNELFSSYSLTAHEISLINYEDDSITNEQQLSEYVINCETAFSREHTQWIARKRK